MRGTPIWLWVVPLVLIGPALLPGRALYYGTVSLQFHPWRVLAWRALLSGELPLWNPLSGMGAPLLANYQSALLYPPTWVLFLFGSFGGEAGMAYGQGWLVVLHLVLAGGGMVRLARALGLPVFSQALAGLAYGCSGYLVARSHFLSVNAAAAWLPWILLFTYRLAAVSPVGRRRPAISLAVVVALLLLAGHAQTAWYTLVFTGLWLVFCLSRPEASAHSQNQGESLVETGRSRLRARLSSLPYFAGALAVALTIAAAQLLPTAELLLQSQRSGGVDEAFAMTYSFWPWRLLGLFTPGVFGSPVTGDYWGYANFWEDAIYIGLIPVLLAIQAVRNHIRGGERAALVRFLIGVTIVSFLLALGSNTPVFPFLYRYVPTFDLFQAATRFTLWAVTCLSILAGVGAADWAAAHSSYARQRARRASAAALALIIAGAVALIALPAITPTFGRAILVAGVFATAAALFGTARTRGPRWRAAVVAVIALDLAIAGWGLNPATELDLYRTHTVPFGLTTDDRVYLPSEDIYSLTFDHFYRFDDFDRDLSGLRDTMLPNLNILDGIASSNQFDPLEVGRYAEWMEILDSARPELRDWMLSRSGVTAVGRVELPGASVFEDLEAAPRVAWFPCARPAGGPDQAMQFVLERDPEFEGYLVLEGLDTGAAWVCGSESGPGAVGTAAILTTHHIAAANRLIVRTESDSAGWLLVRDTFYPGWTAIVDDQAAPVFQAEAVFRAVPVPAGEHTVELRYRPASFFLGAVMSLAGLVAFVYVARRRAGPST
jgi:hypothetical protein